MLEYPTFDKFDRKRWPKESLRQSWADEEEGGHGADEQVAHDGHRAPTSIILRARAHRSLT